MPVHLNIDVSTLQTAKVGPFTVRSGAESSPFVVSFISPRRVVLVGYHVLLTVVYVTTTAAVPSLFVPTLAPAAANVYVGAT